ncbi:MAG: NG,NG-dimethylarginine dimethylaminohydrolase 1 [Nitrospira sp.]|jgi:N-dimethylarginine dimethylaminohydrolase|nr:MAG: NG,NG-dimethylarginine dimethylaminohydrolase 1 [Nitrospira sp.]
MSRLLVCPPDYFQIDYEINPWMRRANAVDPVRAVGQWQALMKVLEQDVGAGLERMQPVQGLPDLVFTANAGVVAGRRALVSRFRYPERQREEAHFERWFREQGYEVLTLDKTLYFEGAGDLLGFPDTWFGGYRQRSDIRVFPRLSEIFQREIIPLELIDSRFYHLDTCFCPLSGGDLLYFPAAFDSYGQTVIAQRLPEERRLTVSEDEALRFACNAVCVGKQVVIPSGCPNTMQLLEARGYRTHAVQLDEFMKSGGAAKCLTLALD